MKYQIVLALNVSFFFTCICPLAETEVYTAVANLGQLLLTNRQIVQILDSYLTLEEIRLRNLRWIKDQYKQMYDRARENQESFFANPVNAFVLVKRLSKDWNNVRYMIEGAPSRALVQNNNFKGLSFPNEEDLSGAAAALLRLQDTYLLKTSQLARGEVAGIKSISELTAGDCYEIGYEAFTLNDYKRAIQWLHEALARVEAEEIKTASKPFILELMAECAFELKYVSHAVELTRQIISMAPQHPDAAKTLSYYENILKTKGDHFSLEEKDGEDYPYSEYEEHNSQSEGSDEQQDFDNYEKLCRGERILSPSVETQLKCRYTTNGNNYLLLQPVKQEILSLDPFICIYHDIISDKDVKLFKEISLPRLSRASVINPDTGVEEAASYRVSKSTWLADRIHPRIAHASKFLKDLTGLETMTAESLHIINYGIGGHYAPHLDFRSEGEAPTRIFKTFGNRIATWIYYLSDVAAGGATVFPRIGVSVKPRKGSAAFWYNLRKSGHGDRNTLHAGCPVLSGSKWVGNKWFHEYGNEFRRKCSLKPWE